jgi:hypothetical protein
MRASAILFLAGAALALVACGTEGSDPQTGIEIGNPSVGLAAQFVLDYGEPDYASLAALAKLPSASEPVLVSELSLGLAEVRHFSSYYVALPVDPLQGLRVWPRTGVDTLVPMAFDEQGKSNLSFDDWEMPDDGYLKEIGFFFPNDERSVIRGSIRTKAGLVPFVYQLNSWESLQLRYHAAQLEVVSDSLFNLPIRFHVPRWIDGVDFSVAAADGDTIYLDSTHNAKVWAALNANFPGSFNCLRWFEVQSNGDTLQDYAEVALQSFNQPGTNWIRDTLFLNPDSNWIVQQQFGGVANVAYASGVVTVDVTKAGTEDFSIQLIQENIPLIAGKNYRVSFKASSSVNAGVTVRLGMYHSPYSSLSPDFTIGLYEGMGFYDPTFKATETNLFSRLEFNLGGTVRKLVISDIKVIQLD